MTSMGPGTVDCFLAEWLLVNWANYNMLLHHSESLVLLVYPYDGHIILFDLGKV